MYITNIGQNNNKIIHHHINYYYHPNAISSNTIVLMIMSLQLNCFLSIIRCCKFIYNILYLFVVFVYTTKCNFKFEINCVSNALYRIYFVICSSYNIIIIILDISDVRFSDHPSNNITILLF